MDQNHGKEQMQWTIIVISGVVLLTMVIAKLVDKGVDTDGAFYLFGTVASLVFGAAVIKKFKE